MTEPPVFTGLGVVAPTGVGAEKFRERTLAGERAIGPITSFDADSYATRIAGEAKGFHGPDHIGSRLLPQTDRMTQMALTAADEAFREALLDPGEGDPYDIGVITASTLGGFEFGQRELSKLWSKGPKHVSAYQSFAWFYAVNSGQISIRHGCKGPSGVVVSDQAGGLDAMAQARRQIRRGISAVLTGGMDAPICPWAWVGLMETAELSSETDARLAYRPFDPEATGWIPGEGGAMLLLEEPGHARVRGAAVHGRLSGYGATFDPRPGDGLGSNLFNAAALAIADARLTPKDIDFVVADAYGLPEQDQAEVDVLQELFVGDVPVVASKSGTGRLLSGAAPLDVAVALQSFADGQLPPAPGLNAMDSIDLVVHQPRAHAGEHALVLSRGVGGFNSAAVVSR